MNVHRSAAGVTAPMISMSSMSPTMSTRDAIAHAAPWRGRLQQSFGAHGIHRRQYQVIVFIFKLISTGAIQCISFSFSYHDFLSMALRTYRWHLELYLWVCHHDWKFLRRENYMRNLSQSAMAQTYPDHC